MKKLIIEVEDNGNVNFVGSLSLAEMCLVKEILSMRIRKLILDPMIQNDKDGVEE